MATEMLPVCAIRASSNQVMDATASWSAAVIA
jgi:hypothetical protein